MVKLPKFPSHLFFVATSLGLFGLAIIFFYFSNGLHIKNLISKTPLTNLKSTPKVVPQSQFSGWIAWWDEQNALNSLNQASGKLTSISPVWFKIDQQGKLQKIPHSLEVPIKTAAMQSNTILIPTITNDFDPVRVRTIINNSDAFQKFAEELANLATTSEYRGFDIDWEEIDPKDQQSFTLFIQRLADHLHTYNLLLTVSVHPQTGQTTDRKVAQGYNLAELSKSADALKIMAYDFHNQNSTAGAIIPFKELAQILDYTSKTLPAEKVILGVPTYGYDWEVEGKQATVVSFSEASDKIRQYSGSIHRNTESNFLVGEYLLIGKKHSIWFEDAETINKIIEKARSFGIYQFSFWRIGVEDPQIWPNLP